MDAKVKEKLEQIDANFVALFENFKDSRVPVLVNSKVDVNAITAETKIRLKEDYLQGHPCAYLKLEVNLSCDLYYYVTGRATRTKYYKKVTAKQPFIWKKEDPNATIDGVDVVPDESSGTTVNFVCSTVRVTIPDEPAEPGLDRFIYKKSVDVGAIAAGASGSIVNLVVEAGSSINGYKIKGVTYVGNEDTDVRIKFYSHDSGVGTSEDTNMLIGYKDLVDPLLDSEEYVQSLECDIPIVDVDGTGELHYIVENIGGTATTTGYFKFIIEEAKT